MGEDQAHTDFGLGFLAVKVRAAKPLADRQKTARFPCSKPSIAMAGSARGCVKTFCRTQNEQYLNQALPVFITMDSAAAD